MYSQQKFHKIYQQNQTDFPPKLKSWKSPNYKRDTKRATARQPNTSARSYNLFIQLNNVSRVLLSPSLADGSSTGPTALWIENSLLAVVVVVIFIYTRTDLEGNPNINWLSNKGTTRKIRR